MPEGDILRRTARTLSAALDGHAVVAAELRWPSAATVDLVGRTVLSTHAYGKHLFTRFDDGRTLHTHLRMEGSWALERTGSAPARSGASREREEPGDVPGPVRDAVEGRSPPRARGPFVRAVLSTADWTAVGHRLGMLDVVPTRDEHTLIAHLGPDVLADDFPTTGLAEALERYRARRGTPVAEVLLDQTVLAGIGTIFMAESLYARRLWPWTPADEVEEPASLLMTARVLMERSVAAQGRAGPTAAAEAGTWLDRQVHGRRGEPCRRCGGPIARGEAKKPPMERPVFYCPRCQAPTA